jgi:DNA-binding transcriptional ArsR family regulator
MRKEVASADFSGEEGEDALGAIPGEEEPATLDRVFSALADPVRRNILRRLDGEDLLVSELAKPFRISLQAVSRHIQVLVRAGLVMQERTGRISRCRLDAGPIYQAAVWVNRYSKYWREQFNFMAVWLGEIDRERSTRAKKSKSSKRSRVAGRKSKT